MRSVLKGTKSRYRQRDARCLRHSPILSKNSHPSPKSDIDYWDEFSYTSVVCALPRRALCNKRAFFKASTLRLSRARKPQRTLAAVSSTPLLDRVSTH
jgi:hypothetical protein